MCRQGIFRFKHVFQSTNEFGIQLVNISPLTEIDMGDAVDNMCDMSQLHLVCAWYYLRTLHSYVEV